MSSGRPLGALPQSSLGLQRRSAGSPLPVSCPALSLRCSLPGPLTTELLLGPPRMSAGFCVPHPAPIPMSSLCPSSRLDGILPPGPRALVAWDRQSGQWMGPRDREDRVPGQQEEEKVGGGHGQLKPAPLGDGVGEAGQNELAHGVEVTDRRGHDGPHPGGHPLHICRGSPESEQGPGPWTRPGGGTPAPAPHPCLALAVTTALQGGPGKACLRLRPGSDPKSGHPNI